MDNYFDELAALLRDEEDFDRNMHEALLLNKSVNERRAQGVTWFPVMLTDSEIGRGDYLSITIKRTNSLEESHKFRFGMPVALFSNYAPNEDRVKGTVAYVNNDSMRIAFRLDELPDWSRRGKLGIDLLFDENSYREMHAALQQAKKIKDDPKQGTLVRMLTGAQPIDQGVAADFYKNNMLNASQNAAVQQVLTGEALTILHGPPGTGKTTTITQAVKALLSNGTKQILLVAPSNTAVDVLTERLDALGVSVVRIGNPVKVSSHLQALTLDGKIDNHRANKECKTLEKQERAYLDMGHKYKRNFGKNEREQRKALFEEARKIRKEIDKVQDFIMADILDSASVITATLVGANHHSIQQRNYDIVIIDEAVQALEPACWIPLLKADRVVLAGDHCQLPPTVKSSMNTQKGLYITLFEKLVKRYPAQVSLLDLQYRMHANIMAYPSLRLYDNRLLAASEVADWTLKDDDAPILFIDSAGAGFEETEEDGAIFNTEEAQFVRAHLRETIKACAMSYSAEDMPSLGVITPYRKQAQLLKTLIEQDEYLKPFQGAIQINTIDGFQGQEKDIIYISLTRSNNEQRIGFLADVRRMNVAMTRAKKKLIVVGDSSTIGEHEFYKGFLDYVETHGAYNSVWEWVGHSD
ncbi:AAA domain-containing protein [Sphingobacterium deserti]|uniref:ATPase AAA n=1 Tax=Sphingobacterium deserti TaxID=1229276 RepID=A0A0B8T2R4_9SPHI|nr:AAA domain-containing protein [Sphingobacterium deserti]KGE13163.1 ATPase AAA [Sphingobacterium deserti]